MNYCYKLLDMETKLDYSKKTVAELITICKEQRIKGYSEKKKDEIIKLILESTNIVIK